MKRLRQVSLAVALLAGLVQVWVHVDWIGGLSEHCDFPEECLSSWLPISFGVVTWSWLTAVSAAGLAWILSTRHHASWSTLTLLGAAWAAVLGSYFLTPVAAPTRNGVIDIDVITGGPLSTGRYLVAELLLLGAAVVFASQLTSSLRDRDDLADPGRAGAGFIPTLVVGTVLALAAGGLVVREVERNQVASEVTLTATERTRYLQEMTEELDGHPDRPRSSRVSDEVLVREGVTACEWLAAQPGGDEARGPNGTEAAYFKARPEVAGDWPFQEGRTPLRRRLLANSWWVICPDVFDDHVSYRVASGD